MFSSHQNPIARLCRCRFAVASCLTLVISGAAHGDVVFDDTFDVGATPTRDDEAADPLDLQWYKLISATLSVAGDAAGIGSGNALNVDNTSGFAKLGSNFELVLLDDLGDVATLSFDVRRLTAGTPTGTAPGFRFGLYDSGGTPLSGDTSNLLSNTANDNGYFITLNVGNSGANAFRETPEQNGILGGPTAPNQLTLGIGSGAAFDGLNDADPHEVVMALTRVADGINVRVGVNGTTVIDVTDVGIDPDTNLPAGLFVTEFDVVGFAIGSSGVVFDYRLDNIRLVTDSLTTLPGDFNGDGKVDAADYVIWRKTDSGNIQGYLDWRQNFGEPAGAGSFTYSTVPEPLESVLLSSVVGAWRLRRRSSA
jgi:hypothetical protein